MNRSERMSLRTTASFAATPNWFGSAWAATSSTSVTASPRSFTRLGSRCAVRIDILHLCEPELPINFARWKEFSDTQDGSLWRSPHNSGIRPSALSLVALADAYSGTSLELRAGGVAWGKGPEGCGGRCLTVRTSPFNFSKAGRVRCERALPLSVGHRRSYPR